MNKFRYNAWQVLAGCMNQRYHIHKENRRITATKSESCHLSQYR